MPIPTFSEHTGVIVPTLANNAVLTTETVVATYSLGANYLTAGTLLEFSAMGQVSSTATLAFKVRIGANGLATDALAGTFATTAAGVANQYVIIRGHVHCLTAGSAGTAYAGGFIVFGNATVGMATAAFAAATVNTTVANKITITLVQSVLQTYTSRTGVMEQVA